jgi:hypothetical protein
MIYLILVLVLPYAFLPLKFLWPLWLVQHEDVFSILLLIVGIALALLRYRAARKFRPLK